MSTLRQHFSGYVRESARFVRLFLFPAKVRPVRTKTRSKFSGALPDSTPSHAVAVVPVSASPYYHV